MSSPQKLRLYVGEPMRDVLARNTRDRYDPEKQRDDSPIIWPVHDSIPTIFDMTYDDTNGIVRLPHARMVWATQYAGIVTDILVSASEHKLAIGPLYTELQDVADQLIKAGWRPSAPLPTLATLQAAVSGSRATGLEAGVLTFQKRSVAAVLELKGFSEGSGNASTEAAEYTLNVRFSDEQMENKQQKKVYEERRRVNGNADDNLSLAYWLPRAKY